MAAQEYYGSSPPFDKKTTRSRGGEVLPPTPGTPGYYGERRLPPYGQSASAHYSSEYPSEKQPYGPQTSQGAQAYYRKFGGAPPANAHSPPISPPGQSYHATATPGPYKQVVEQHYSDQAAQHYGTYSSQVPPGYEEPYDPNAPPGERGLGSTLIGGAAGGYLAHQAGGSFLGTVGGAIGGAIAANVVGHKIKKHRKEKKEKEKEKKDKKERRERRERREKEKRKHSHSNSHTTSYQLITAGGQGGKLLTSSGHGGHGGGKTSSTTLEVALGSGGRRKHRRDSSTHGSSGHALSYGAHSSLHQSTHSASYGVSHSSRSHRRRDSSSESDRSYGYSRHSSYSRRRSQSGERPPMDGILSSLYAYGYSTGGGHAFISGTSERPRFRRSHRQHREHREHRDHHHKRVGSADSYSSSSSSSSESSSDSSSDSDSDSDSG